MDSIRCDSPCVISYLGILQTLMARMAANSTSSKNWCVTVVTGVIAIVANKGNPAHVSLAFFPLLIFAFLDSYYLGLERCFRKDYNEFVSKLHQGKATSDDLFRIPPAPEGNDLISCMIHAARSLSIWPFFGIISFMLIIVRVLIK